MQIDRIFPFLRWSRGYDRSDLRPDLLAGVTIAAMLVPQAMAYAMLAGLPPKVGLYASTVPVLAYALFGSSRQLAVGPVAIVSLLTAAALAPLAEEGTDRYLSAAALLALMVGVAHVVFGLARLGALVSLLSHAVLVGFTAAAAIIIGFSQIRHILGISIERKPHFYETVVEVARNLEDSNGATLSIGLASIVVLLFLKYKVPGVPGALVVVVGSVGAVEVLDLTSKGVRVVGDIPGSVPVFGLPDADGSLVSNLVVTTLVITLVGFMESIAVAKVYSRRYGYKLNANQELVGLGAANVASGLFGGYPVTGGFSRTAVNDAAGARTPLASIVTALLVLVTVAFFTPLISSLPNAALGAIIVSAVVSLVDVAEMRHIASVKRSDLISLGVAFTATLALGIELGIGVAVASSVLVVFIRISMPHRAVLGQIAGTMIYRNVDRFPEANTFESVRIIRIDAALSFINAANIQSYLIREAESLRTEWLGLQATEVEHTSGEGHGTWKPAIVLDAAGINDVDATGVDMLHEVHVEIRDLGIGLHLADVRGPVRDVLRRSGLWVELDGCIHASTHDAVEVIVGTGQAQRRHRRCGVDEHDSLGGEGCMSSGPPVAVESRLLG